MGCYVFSSQCDDSDLFVCRTVVVDRPIVAKGNIKSGQILYPIGIAATNHIRRNIVASLSHTGRDAFDSLFGGRQPKIEQRHEVTFCLCPFYELYIRTRGQCRFNHMMMLYRFDKKLRLLMFNEIEKIEIAIRRAVMQITADMTGNPFWLTDSSYFLDSSKFNETMRAISKEYSKSKEEFILHFKRTYSEPYPPSWILGELLTIGNVNAIYRNIKQNRIRKRIAKRFGLPINVFESWLTVIAVTRNACGHHSRVWNKQNAIQPAIPNNPEGEWITLPTDSMRAYFDLCIIKYFLNVISPNNDMQSKITWLFIRFPEIDLKALGFPQGWETEPLWR